jgi:hypothetical protein
VNPFAALAARVDAAWSRAGYQPARLAAIAAEALGADGDLPASFDAIADWVFDEPGLPAQRSLDQAFGQPPVTVYVDDRFFIELLFWHTGTTGIHQHAFTGAFRVLAGSSLHTIHDFAPTLVVDPRLELGELAVRSTEVLATGAVRAIHPGRALIHSTFHLDNPSVTLVVRTHADRTAELEYKPPGLALDPSARDARTIKLLQLMDLLARQPGDGLRRRVAAALAGCDAFTGVLLLLRARRQVDVETFAALLACFGERFPALAARVGDVADEEWRRLAVTDARARITDPQHRFLLALVMNLPSRDAVLDAIAQRYPDARPIETLLGWLRACARRDQLGFALDDTLLAIVRGTVEGRSPAQIAQHLRAPPSDVERAIATLRRLAVLAPLFRG